jgi:hypothetical protein
MVNLDQLRSRQEQRMSLVLESWNEAKEHLKEAIAFAAAKEREYREVSEDVRRRIGALELVGGMARELGEGVSADRSLNAPENHPLLTRPDNAAAELKALEMATTPVPVQSGPPQPPEFDGMMQTSSRPLFPSPVRSRLARLSILQ